MSEILVKNWKLLTLIIDSMEAPLCAKENISLSIYSLHESDMACGA